MGWLCDQVTAAGSWAIADFVCPTPATRAAFGPATVIWVDTIKEGRFADTNKLFVNPEPGSYYFRVDTQDCEFWSKYIMEELDFDEHPSWIKTMIKGLKST